MSTRPQKNYRRLNAHRFLNKFNRGGEPLLSAFFRKHLPASALAAADPLSVADVLTFLGTCDATGKEVTRALNDAYDMSGPQGAYFLRSAAKEANIVPDPENKLIPEHLSLKIFTEWPPVFVAAYDRLGLAKTDNFSFYAGKAPVTVPDPVSVADVFQNHLRSLKGSPRVVVRAFTEDIMVNFIFYHEKRPSAPLIFEDNLEIRPLWHRPAQQDFICYNTKTGHVEIEIGSRGEQVAIRKKFAEACTGDAEHFEQSGSTAFLALDTLLSPDFTLSPDLAILRRIELDLAQEEEPFFEISSQDVFRTIDRNGLRSRFEGARVAFAALALRLPGVNRPSVVELTAPNKIAFPRSIHTETVFGRLRTLTLLAK